MEYMCKWIGFSDMQTGIEAKQNMLKKFKQEIYRGTRLNRHPS